jgi:splicing suppressor protein 51
MANVRFAKSESDTDAYWIVQLVSIITYPNGTNTVSRAQPYCAECRRTVVQLSTRNINLKACAQCRIISTCNACSTTHTPASCTAYQDFANIENFRISFFEDMGRASVVECTRSPRKSYKPLSDAANWYDYYVNISDKSQIRNKIKNDFSAIEESSNPLPAEAIENEEQRRLFLTLATDNLTMPLTILSALEDLSLAQKPTISIHLLGATDREFTSMAVFEEILHLVPTLKTLHITAVGPSSLVDATGPYMDDVSLPCCPACQASRRQRIIRSYQGLYHDFVSSAFYKKPDLIVAFNSGHVDEDGAAENWTPTIQMIVDNGVPALFTTYNVDEAWREEARLRSLGAKIVVQPGENRWRGLVPMPEFLESEGTMWFQNWYRYVIQGRLA